MTDKTVKNPRYIIDPVAFFVALVGGPVLFTLVTFWLYFVPAIALALGGIPYLVVGTPVLLWHLRRHPVRAADTAWVALLALCAAWAVWLALMLLLNGQHSEGLILMAIIFLPFGALFATIWGASFGWLYLKLVRDFYTGAHAL